MQNITLTLTVSNNITPAILHELLCRAIHEGDEISYDTLRVEVADITVVDPTGKDVY